MIRFVVSFVFVCFVPYYAYGQPIDENAKIGCWVDTTRNCMDMAFNAQPQQPWANCEVALCEVNPVTGLLQCVHEQGLLVTDAEKTYKDVDHVAPGVQGKKNNTHAVSQIKCGEVYKCHCRQRAIGWSCLFELTKEKDYKPREYQTSGTIACWG
jgi:hypothetical protein